MEVISSSKTEGEIIGKSFSRIILQWHAGKQINPDRESNKHHVNHWQLNYR